GEAVLQALLEAKANPVPRPVDPKKLARRPRALKAKIGTVTVPETDDEEYHVVGREQSGPTPQPVQRIPCDDGVRSADGAENDRILFVMLTLVGIVLFSVLLVRANFRDAYRVDGHFFFLGAGFLLLETKSVTEMSLLFGSTWTVNVLVFTSILVFILIANSLVATDRAPGTNTLFGLLFGALVVSYLIPARSLLPFGITGQWILGSVLVALPIMFAAGIFARMFATRVATTQALAFNLLGAIVGGVLEYSSMVIGVKGLYLVAGVCYAGAALSHRRQAATKLPEKSLHPA
ncbi:MAG: hypothetical protein ACE5FJ_09455, partial [Gemmatimonadales bacterium]